MTNPLNPSNLKMGMRQLCGCFVRLELPRLRPMPMVHPIAYGFSNGCEAVVWMLDALRGWSFLLQAAGVSVEPGKTHAHPGHTEQEHRHRDTHHKGQIYITAPWDLPSHL